MVKQPERYEGTSTEEALDIEIAVARSGESTFFKTETNHEIDFGGKLSKQKVDFTMLHLDINEDLKDVPLLLFFRGMNYTHDDAKTIGSQC